MITLCPNTVFEIVVDAGGKLRGKGDKRTLCCVLHDETRPSAFAVGSTNVYGCSVCFPGSAITAKQLSERRGLDWSRYRKLSIADLPVPVVAKHTKVFTASDAQDLWHACRARALDDACAEADGRVYRYLVGRGLGEAWDLRLYGIVASGMVLHHAVRNWPARGYQIVVPLYDSTGRLSNVQARAVVKIDPKVLVPEGSVMAGTVFANDRALALLRGEPSNGLPVVLGEGLTDFLALSCAVSSIPVFCAPGTGAAKRSVSGWAHGRHVLVALDQDLAGENVLQETADALHEAGATRVRRVLWPKPAKDACDVVALRGIQGLAELVGREITRGAA